MILGRDVYIYYRVSIYVWSVNHKSSEVMYACKSAYVHKNEIKKMNAIDLDPVGHVGSSTMRIVQLFRCAMWPVGLFSSSLAKKYQGHIVLWRNLQNYLYLKLFNFDKKYLFSRFREINNLCLW